jgi:hypothetical protein
VGGQLRSRPGRFTPLHRQLGGSGQVAGNLLLSEFDPQTA